MQGLIGGVLCACFCRAGVAKPAAASTAIAPVSEEDRRVQKILANPELRELLMDVRMQEVLRECADPGKFQQHMRDPVMSRKIKLLMDNGLVGTER